MIFRVIGAIDRTQVIAIGRSIRTLKQLRAKFGPGRWRKLKGFVTVELDDGSVRRAELHWYEAHGVGRVMMKVKQYVD